MEREIQVGDLVKYHCASAPGFKLITVLGIRYSKVNASIEWVSGLEFGDTTQRLFDPEHCEIISAAR